MAIERVDPERCVGCAQCFNACYGDVFRMDDKVNAAVVKYPEECAVGCWCVAVCPANAIIFTPVKHAPMFTSWG
jgi:NAD-dependent dihydropyrimidine dehydrogenase PreA subunit